MSAAAMARRKPISHWTDEAQGSPLSPAELDFAARRMPVCTCPRLITADGKHHVTHRPACFFAAIGGAQ